VERRPGAGSPASILGSSEAAMHRGSLALPRQRAGGLLREGARPALGLDKSAGNQEGSWTSARPGSRSDRGSWWLAQCCVSYAHSRGY
jgi:hypothetical protein